MSVWRGSPLVKRKRRKSSTKHTKRSWNILVILENTRTCAKKLQSYLLSTRRYSVRRVPNANCSRRLFSETLAGASVTIKSETSEAAWKSVRDRDAGTHQPFAFNPPPFFIGQNKDQFNPLARFSVLRDSFVAGNLSIVLFWWTFHELSAKKRPSSPKRE